MEYELLLTSSTKIPLLGFVNPKPPPSRAAPVITRTGPSQLFDDVQTTNFASPPTFQPPTPPPTFQGGASFVWWVLPDQSVPRPIFPKALFPS